MLKELDALAISDRLDVARDRVRLLCSLVVGLTMPMPRTRSPVCSWTYGGARANQQHDPPRHECERDRPSKARSLNPLSRALLALAF
jgi:hypothetical protein